jgi:HK97 family phage portal protein
MNLFQQLFVKAASKTNGFRFIPEWVKAAFLPVSLRRLLDGYRKNSAVSACVTALAFSFPEAPLLIGYETPDGRFMADYSHPALSLIRQPNPDMGEVELMQFAITYASVGGSLYLWKQRGMNNRVIRLWPFSEVNMTPLPGHDTEEGFVRGYEFDPGNGQAITLPKEDVIHWKWMVDPEQPWRGIGALEFALRDADRDTEANAYIYALLKNNAVPPVVVTLTEGEELTEAKAKRLRNEWKTKLGGDNRGDLAFLESGMKAEKLGFDLQQLAGEALNAVPEARIAAAFRVPPVVAGLSVGLKRSDYGDQAARRAFTELTLSALWRSLASEIWNGLKGEFPGTPPNYTARFDLRQVRALQEEESKLWERITNAFNRSLLTRAQAKQVLGIEPETGDDVYFVSLASEFVPADQEVVRASSTDKSIEFKGSNAIKPAATLRKIRIREIGKMTEEVKQYFAQLAKRAVERARGKSKDLKSLPAAEELIQPSDKSDLVKIVQRFYVEICTLSWETWNIACGADLLFDLTDPIVTNLLGMVGRRVSDIQEETLSALRQVLQYGSANGWSIEDLVAGDPATGVRGIMDVIIETYQGRARTIARTELGEAQNRGTVSRYQSAGVNLVEILDNGNDDDDDACKIANGQIWALEYFSSHSLEHPNCTRAAAPYFGDQKPDRS